ncbi:hypothetical protein J0A71_11g22800 [Encephalitozoon cuniculi]|nr:hypothetical protein J0A71_01g02560 [Encephalitozoon cuniculi]UYI26445.1 hypothetical protein J0A71_02g02700 [Encephalitozoon cuniculi]UYI26907.1 hypothetical protein J0A71_03g07470 [Encephalitozoon cuniculi]UYI27147.1 hypothetical protein J0A71_04g09990 [Encephalitozoon cuniculi]UYI27362.1 hypothetical protein J0A71_05g12250 [Encephalitozoon cuniculi]
MVLLLCKGPFAIVEVNFASGVLTRLCWICGRDVCWRSLHIWLMNGGEQAGGNAAGSRGRNVPGCGGDCGGGTGLLMG